MVIRNESPSDRKTLHRLITSAFSQTDEADLVAALRTAGNLTLSLVADDNGEIVGHVALSRMAAPFRALALAPVSVAPDRQRSGIGARLVRVALDRAREGGWDAVFVLGDTGYYTRFGFDAEAAAGFASPYAGPHFMMIALGETPLTTRGELRHAPAFDALG